MKKNKKNEEMDIVFLLDRSGSMQNVCEDTIGGYNSYIKEQKGKNVKVTTVLFDDKYEILGDRVNVDEVKELNNKTYFVRGCTALLDAIGKTIKKVDVENPNKVIFIITTDGLENASKIYSKEEIKEMIEGHSNWEFMYIGANIDSYQEGSGIGIKLDNISNYETSSKGVSKMFKALGKASEEFYSENKINTKWKSELENYIKKENM